MNKYITGIAIAIALPTIGFAAIKLNQPLNSQTEHYRTIPQCHQLTKSECVELLKNQVVTAKQQAANYWEGLQ